MFIHNLLKLVSPLQYFNVNVMNLCWLLNIAFSNSYRHRLGVSLWFALKSENQQNSFTMLKATDNRAKRHCSSVCLSAKHVSNIFGSLPALWKHLQSKLSFTWMKLLCNLMFFFFGLQPLVILLVDGIGGQQRPRWCKQLASWRSFIPWPQLSQADVHCSLCTTWLRPCWVCCAPASFLPYVDVYPPLALDARFNRSSCLEPWLTNQAVLVTRLSFHISECDDCD